MDALPAGAAALVLVSSLTFLLYRRCSTARVCLVNRHVLVTGGSKGIGLEVAIDAASQGAHVTILARNQDDLDSARLKIEAERKDEARQRVQTFSVDVAGSYLDVEVAVKSAEGAAGPVDVLVNCAGTSSAASFEDLPISEFKRLMEINYLGSVYPTRAVVQDMKARRRGHIVFVSSQAGQVGLFGFSAYSPTKFALRGLAECLSMEVKPYDVSVSVAFPPDTDTPGYKEEMKTKPRETALMSDTSGLFAARDVARLILKDSLAGKFLITAGVDGYMLGILTAGMSRGDAASSIQQVLLMGLFRLISLFYIRKFDKIVKKCADERRESEAEAEN